MQELLELTAGAIFHDGLAYLAPMRERLAWYPDDVWRAMLAAQWQRLSQEEAFVGRCSEVGDALGAAIVTARLVRDLMRLCFLMERRYAPYSKWLGTAFVRWLHAGPALAPILTALLAATDWQTRERHLSAAYEQIAGMHNALALTPTVDPTTRRYFGRPYRVLHAERFAAVLRATLPHDPALREASFIGAIDQFVDSTDVLGHRDRRYHFAALYG